MERHFIGLDDVSCRGKGGYRLFCRWQVRASLTSNVIVRSPTEPIPTHTAIALTVENANSTQQLLRQLVGGLTLYMMAVVVMPGWGRRKCRGEHALAGGISDTSMRTDKSMTSVVA